MNAATRVVCANALGVALGESTKARWAIRHTKSAPERQQEAARVLPGNRGRLQAVRLPRERSRDHALYGPADDEGRGDPRCAARWPPSTERPCCRWR